MNGQKKAMKKVMPAAQLCIRCRLVEVCRMPANEFRFLQRTKYDKAGKSRPSRIREFNVPENRVKGNAKQESK